MIRKQPPGPDFKPELDHVSMQIVRNISKSPQHCSDLMASKRMAAGSQREYLNVLSKTKETSNKIRILSEEKRKKESQECTFKPKKFTARMGSPLYVQPGAHHRNNSPANNVRHSNNMS